MSFNELTFRKENGKKLTVDNFSCHFVFGNDNIFGNGGDFLILFGHGDDSNDFSVKVEIFT